MNQEHFTFVDKSFVGKTLELDGRTYSNCSFKRCTFIYSGGNPPALSGCSFDDCGWQFSDAAARTLGFFSGLYNGGFDQMVEATFHQVRKGAAFANVPKEGDKPELETPKSPSIFGFKAPRILKISKKK